ncbi:MAG TPA: RNA polymerase sigma factor [Pirellulales bacterium]|jgi:RNA polymerase sigma-70 factor (ECF subfamily)
MLGPEPLRQLLDEYGAALVLYARQWCRAPEDVVQESLVRLIREKQLPENIVGWLFRVVRNTAISASRSESRRARHEAVAARQSSPWFVELPDEALDAQAAALALAALALEQRETIVLRLWGGLSFEQIAEVTETSVSSAHRRYVAGLTALREREIPCTTEMNRKR